MYSTENFVYKNDISKVRIKKLVQTIIDPWLGVDHHVLRLKCRNCSKTFPKNFFWVEPEPPSNFGSGTHALKKVRLNGSSAHTMAQTISWKMFRSLLFAIRIHGTRIYVRAHIL